MGNLSYLCIVKIRNNMVKIQEIEVKSVMTKSNLPVADFSVNPYVGCLHGCKYCYASFMKRFTNHPEPKEAFFGSVTDCYQPHEAKYKRTRALLEQLQGSGISVSIATKSDLVLRDLDLIKTFPHARVSWSINTLDESFRREMDVAVSIERRLDAMRQFYEAGVETTCFISPIFPGITDVEAIIRKAKNCCNLVWLENLNLRGDYKGKILAWIHEHHPELDGLYHDIYTKKDRSYWMQLDMQMRAFCEAEGLPYVRNDDSVRSRYGQPPVVVNYFFHEEIVNKGK